MLTSSRALPGLAKHRLAFNGQILPASAQSLVANQETTDLETHSFPIFHPELAFPTIHVYSFAAHTTSTEHRFCRNCNFPNNLEHAVLCYRRLPKPRAGRVAIVYQNDN